jgi:hypothetical protein
MIQIAYHMLKSSKGDYLEWLANKIIMSAKTLNIRMQY